MVKTAAVQASPAANMFKDFLPLSVLWEGAGAPYPSRCSADWALRRLRAELIRRNAMVRHRGRLMVHLARFREVVEADAARCYSSRYGND